MRDYQPRKDPYKLERTVYRRVLAVARDYDRMVRDYREILYATPARSGKRGAGRSDPTAIKAARREQLSRDIDAVERALNVVPEEYRKAVMCKIVYDVWPRGTNADQSTLYRWRARCLYALAINLGLI